MNSNENNMEDVFFHPKLGELYAEDVDWQTDEVLVPFCNTPIGVCLANGTDNEPSTAASSGYNWVESHWSEVLKIIEIQAFEFYALYAEAVAVCPKFATPEQLWGTEVLLNLRVFSKEDLTVTTRFTWQDDADPHEITFYIEKGRCESHSVDG